MATKVGKFLKKAVSKVKSTVKKLSSNKSLAASAIGAVNPVAGAAFNVAAKKPSTPQPKNMSLASGGYLDDKGKFNSGQPGAPSSSQNMTYNTKTGGSPTKKNPIITSVSPTATSSSLTYDMRPSSNRTSDSTSTQSYSISESMGSVDAPSYASSITSGVSSPIMPTAKTGITGISSNIAANTANQLETDSEIQRIKREQDAQDALRAEQEAKDKSFLGDLFKKTPQEAGEEAAERINFQEEKYFQERSAKEKEVETLSLEYNKVKEAMDLQIAASTDKLASNNFINNQIAQIERNAAPKLNRIAADINVKQATLAQMRGDFEEARGYIKDAIAAATAEQKYKYDSWSAFRDINKETFNRLDSRTQKALDRAYDLAEKDYERELDQKDMVGELMLKYNHLGAKIGINDSYETAIRKASQFDPTPKSQRGDTGVTNSDVDAYAQAYLDEAIEITSIPEKYRASALRRANELAAKAMASSPAPAAQAQSSGGGFINRAIDSISNFLFKR